MLITVAPQNIYKTKVIPLKGSVYKRVYKSALSYYQIIKSRTKRKPYTRSTYFKKKIFLDIFWSHLFDKGRKIRTQRLKLLPCAIELLERTTCSPEIIKSEKFKRETFYRFTGQTESGQLFIVQVKKRNNHLYFISVY